MLLCRANRRQHQSCVQKTGVHAAGTDLTEPRMLHRILHADPPIVVDVEQPAEHVPAAFRHAAQSERGIGFITGCLQSSAINKIVAS